MQITTKQLDLRRAMEHLLATGKRKEICAASLAKEGKLKTYYYKLGKTLSKTIPRMICQFQTAYFCRTIAREHIPKKHLDFENPVKTDKVFDNTANRVYGEPRQELFGTHNTEYGTGKNKADNLAHMGRKTKIIEQEIAMKVAEEMRERENLAEAERQRRFFDTTNRSTYDSKDLSQNVIGRKVMRTQDGSEIEEVGYDILQVETGMIKVPQKQKDFELRARVPKGDFHVTKPVTIYTEALERKNFAMSCSTGPNPFAKSSGFTQPLN